MSKNIPTPPEGWTLNGLYIERMGDGKTPKPKGVEYFNSLSGWRSPLWGAYAKDPMTTKDRYRLPWPGEGYHFVESGSESKAGDEFFTRKNSWMKDPDEVFCVSSVFPTRRKIKHHNPSNLTPEQYGAGEGYRLLDEDEVDRARLYNHRVAEASVEGHWVKGWNGNDPSVTYRTTLTRKELRRARFNGRFPEGINPPFNQGEVKDVAKSAPTATEMAIGLLTATIRAKDVHIESLQKQRDNFERIAVENGDSLRVANEGNSKRDGIICGLHRKIDRLLEENRKLKEEGDCVSRIADENGQNFDSIEKKLNEAYSTIQQHINAADELRKERDELAEAYGKLVSDKNERLTRRLLECIIEHLAKKRDACVDVSGKAALGCAIEAAQDKLIQILSEE